MRDPLELEAALEVLEGVVDQACRLEDGRVDSHALTAYRDALVLLARHGRFQIESHVGRRVVGRWTPADVRPQ